MLICQNKKRGVSPLIATALLIAMTVALGAIVITWGKSLIVEQSEAVSLKTERSMKCAYEVQPKILEINNVRFMCYNRSGSNNLEFILENQGSGNVEGVRVFLLDNVENIKTADLLIPLGGHNRTRYNLSIETADNGAAFAFPPSFVEISLIAAVHDSSIDVCSDNKITVEEVEMCND